jgi:uncharacterized membrane protein
VDLMKTTSKLECSYTFLDMKFDLRLFTKPWVYLVVITIGSFLKIYDFQYKLFWRDEVASVLYASGVKESVYISDIPENEIISVKYFDSLLHNAGKPNTIQQEIRGTLSNTHLTPLHYILLTVWYRVVGDDVMDYRLFSVFMFILSLPFIFLLAKTLFKSSLGGWIAASLYAVSPFIHCQSQEARYYIIWIFFFILSNCLFLFAVKYKNVWWWISYAVASIFALYTSILSATFLAGHLAYVLICHKHLLMKLFVTQVVMFIAYMPWLYFLYSVRDAIQSGMSWHHTYAQPSIFSLELLFFQMIGWARSFTYFSDFTDYFVLYTGKLQQELYLALFVDLLTLCIIFYCIRHLIRKSSKEVKWFLIAIVAPLFLFFYLSDVIRHGLTSVLWRYQVLNMVGVIIVVSNLLTDKIREGRPLFICLYCSLVILGVISTARIAEERCWNTSPDCPSIINVAKIINQETSPLILTDLGGFGEYSFDNFLSIVNESKAENADVMYCKGTIPDIRRRLVGKPYSKIFVLQASDSFINLLKLQLGDNLTVYRTESNSVYPQTIWQIKL